MMIPFAKKIFSYLWDIQIDYRSSDINGDLIVFLSKGRYQLCTANAIYSFEDRYDNFANIFKSRFNFERLAGNKTLILGLGLGSVPLILDKIKPKYWHFTAVEIDEAVCDLAAIYGYQNILSPIHTIVGDAIDFVESTNEKYDLICIDIFIDDIMPEESKEIAFLKNIDQRLNEGGVVIANTLAFSEEHKRSSRAFYEGKFKTVFPKAELVHTHLNFMLVSDRKFLTLDPTLMG